MRRAACSFSTSVCGPFLKTKWNVASGRPEPFSICQFSGFFPCDTRRLSQRHWSARLSLIFLKCNYESSMLFLHLCFWAILKKKWNVASARHKPFSMRQFPVLFPPCDTPRVSKKPFEHKTFSVFSKVQYEEGSMLFLHLCLWAILQKKKMECCLRQA